MTDKTKARWEWRVFSTKPFTRLAPLFDKMTAAHSKSDKDIYILREDLDANIKVRNGRLDIKLLTETAPCGAEKWAPAFRCDFPPDAAARAAIRELCGAELPDMTSENSHPDADGFRFVEVVKERDIFVVESTIIEIGTADLLDTRMWTLCAESEHLDQIEYFVKGCRMESERVTGYAAMLKAALHND